MVGLAMRRGQQPRGSSRTTCRPGSIAADPRAVIDSSHVAWPPRGCAGTPPIR